MADSETKIKFGADTSDLSRGLSDANSQVKKALDEMKATVSSQMNAIKQLIVGALSVETFKSAIEGTLAYNESVLKLSRTMGSTTEDASVLTTAIRMIGASTDDYMAAVMKLNMHLKGNEDALNQLGVVTRDVNTRALLPQQEIMDNALKTMGDYKEGSDRNQFSIYAFGRGAAQTAQFLKLNHEVMERATVIAKQYGLVIGQDAAVQTEQFGIELNVAGIILDTIKIKVGNELLPQLVKLSGWFSEVGPTAISVAVGSIKIVITVFEGLAFVVRGVLDLFMNLFNLVYNGLTLIGAVAIKVFAGDFKGAMDTLSYRFNLLQDEFASGFDRIGEDGVETWNRLDTLWSQPIGKKMQDPVPKGTKAFNKPETPAADTGGDKVNADMQKEAALQLKLREMELDQEAAHQVAMINLKEDAAKASLKLHEASGAEEAAAMRALEEEKYKIEFDQLMKRQILLMSEPEEVAKINGKIEALADKHRLALQKINEKELEDKRKEMQQWLGVITQAVDRSVLGFVQGTTTATQAIRNIWNALVAEFINVIIKKMVDQWLVGELMKFNWSNIYHQLMIALGWETATQEIAAKTLEAETSQAIQATTGVLAVTSNAAVGAAAAAASVAAIPFIGWAMAPGVMATHLAMVMALTPMAAAAGGFDIPAGLDPIVQTHAREMILPADLAENVRNMTGGGGGGDLHIHVTAMDSQDVERALSNNTSGLSRAIVKAQRNFALRQRAGRR